MRRWKVNLHPEKFDDAAIPDAVPNKTLYEGSFIVCFLLEGSCSLI